MYYRSEASEESNKGKVGETLTVWPMPGALPGTKEMFHVWCMNGHGLWTLYGIYVCLQYVLHSFYKETNTHTHHIVYRHIYFN